MEAGLILPCPNVLRNFCSSFKKYSRLPFHVAIFLIHTLPQRFMNVDKMKGKIIISLSNKGKSDLARTFDFCQFLKAQLLLKTFSVIFSEFREQ